MDILESLGKLPSRVQQYFQSDDIRLAIKRAAFAFGLPDVAVPAIADVVGKVFLFELDLMRFDEELIRLAGIKPGIAHGIALRLTDVIFSQFPEVYNNVTDAQHKFSVNATPASISDAEVEELLKQDEPWLGTEAPKTVVQRRVMDTSLSPQKQAPKTVRLPLLQAMSEYRRLSEQIITNEKIKLKSSLEAVRPSLGNWLRAYRDELGIGRHEPVQRGNFLFQSVNGKRITNQDRARLNLILKSVEEGFALEIDMGRQVIIFPSADETSMELTQVKSQPANQMMQFQGRSQRQAPTGPQRPLAVPVPSSIDQPKSLFAKVVAPEKNVSGETLHFSTGHVLPAERAMTAQSEKREGNLALREMEHPTQAIRHDPQVSPTRSPYSIRPLRPRNGNGA